jgi:hypothetical protein
MPRARRPRDHLAMGSVRELDQVIRHLIDKPDLGS